MSIFSIAVLIIVVLLVSIREIKEYERGIKFTMGRYSSIMQPGWRLVIPVFQSMQKVDMRLKAVDVPHQEAITKDNVSININAVIYYKVIDAAKSIIAVENFYYATSQLAQTTMRNVAGEVTLDHLLENRVETANKIQVIVEKAVDSWGIEVISVELKDIVLPTDMKRTIAKEAEAEREKRAIIIRAEAELSSAENLVKAANMLSQAPGSLHLRTLQSINDISSDQSNTTVWMVPVEALRALEGIKEYLDKARA
ncbi:slipin family protein [Candidatus Peregrinibacteria bacterium]|nr:slipin family protein [Candidatus Peregrinibacteria bacterium]